MIIAGDFNARFGKDVANWAGVIGPNGIRKFKSNGEMLLTFCSEFQLVITNTIFRHKHAEYLNAYMVQALAPFGLCYNQTKRSE